MNNSAQNSAGDRHPSAPASRQADPPPQRPPVGPAPPHQGLQASAPIHQGPRAPPSPLHINPNAQVRSQHLPSPGIYGPRNDMYSPRNPQFLSPAPSPGPLGQSAGPAPAPQQRPQAPPGMASLYPRGPDHPDTAMPSRSYAPQTNVPRQPPAEEAPAPGTAPGSRHPQAPVSGVYAGANPAASHPLAGGPPQPANAPRPVWANAGSAGEREPLVGSSSPQPAGGSVPSPKAPASAQPKSPASPEPAKKRGLFSSLFDKKKPSEQGNAKAKDAGPKQLPSRPGPHALAKPGQAPPQPGQPQPPQQPPQAAGANAATFPPKPINAGSATPAPSGSQPPQAGTAAPAGKPGNEAAAKTEPPKKVEFEDNEDKEAQGGESFFKRAFFRRKRSLVRPEREVKDPHHRLAKYRQHAAQMEMEGRGLAVHTETGHSHSTQKTAETLQPGELMPQNLEAPNPHAPTYGFDENGNQVIHEHPESTSDDVEMRNMEGAEKESESEEEEEEDPYKLPSPPRPKPIDITNRMVSAAAKTRIPGSQIGGTGLPHAHDRLTLAAELKGSSMLTGGSKYFDEDSSIVSEDAPLDPKEENERQRRQELMEKSANLARRATQKREYSQLNMFNDSAPKSRRFGSGSRVQPPAIGYDDQVGLTLPKPKSKKASRGSKVPMSPWMTYANIVTCFLPGSFLSLCGMKTPDRQKAFREKIAMLTISMYLMAFVGYLTFGFTDSVCHTTGMNFKAYHADSGSMIFNGLVYSLDGFEHPSLPGIEGGTNPIYDTFQAASKDGSFLFQKVNGPCEGVFKPGPNSTGIPQDDKGRMGWYFPCNIFNQFGNTAVNQTGYKEGRMCHTSDDARRQFGEMKVLGNLIFDWSQLKNESRNLAVFDNMVLDLQLLNWLDKSIVEYPPLFDQMRQEYVGTGVMNWTTGERLLPPQTYNQTAYWGRDITAALSRQGGAQLGECLKNTIGVGFVNKMTIGCVASQVVLYVSLVFICGTVVVRFLMAVIFGWFISYRLGAYSRGTMTSAERNARDKAIEAWSNDINEPPPTKYRTTVPKKTSQWFTSSRFTAANKNLKPDVTRIDNFVGSKPTLAPPESMSSRSLTPNMPSSQGAGNRLSDGSWNGNFPASSSITSISAFTDEELGVLAADPRYPLLHEIDPGPRPPDQLQLSPHIVPKPPASYQPFNFPLVHGISLVTAYSESIDGLRTTLDSLATSDYPNSHKAMLVVADGLVKGSGNDLYTHEIVLSMMTDFITPPEEVKAHSCLSVADGMKRHNMCKVYGGFYKYDDATVPQKYQQRVPIVLVAKVGTPLEAHDKKPGNRGKRDSQIIVMSFFQKVMFDERMSELDFVLFNTFYQVTGVTADRFEVMLCVDADTKIFPDSFSRLTSVMVDDPEVMGLCGETKIANKMQSWVTMIQVFEYYVSHHLTKGFEAVFGGVTCLPGCFSMFRIKTPKGPDGYYVPVLCNPDVVERYSENVVDTLHKKNLLLLGEDRFLTTLLLMTFPRRKMLFVPQAVCKTQVPDTFRVLLSQRRRWINSTVHNLFELLLVNDLCGTFCFSMQFTIFMELVGTLVLPAAIAFTFYIVVIAIIPSKPTPVISLILLAFVLGLPGVLIVITSRRYQYLGWLVVYLISLPIWNFLLPAYAYLHMDDFSWGSTREIQTVETGKRKKVNEADYDPQKVALRRWSEWEVIRRQQQQEGYKKGILRRADEAFKKQQDDERRRLQDIQHAREERERQEAYERQRIWQLQNPHAAQGSSPDVGADDDNDDDNFYNASANAEDDEIPFYPDMSQLDRLLERSSSRGHAPPTNNRSSIMNSIAAMSKDQQQELLDAMVEGRPIAHLFN